MQNDDSHPEPAPEPRDADAVVHHVDVNAPGIDPAKSTPARPGSQEKVLMLSARYTAGLALWHTRDRREHGPKESELMGAIAEIDQQPLPLPDSKTHRKKV